MVRLCREYARKHGFNAVCTVADMCQLSFSDQSFDWAIAVASLHHLKGAAARLAALCELRRVLKPGGQAFITVWNRWQPRFWTSGPDVMVPWRQKSETLLRYYHLFSYGELESLAKRAGFRVISARPEHGYHLPFKTFSRNICLLVEKT